MIEVYKYLHGLSPELMTVIFTLRRNHYIIRNIRLFDSENPRSVRFGVDAIAFRASQFWQSTHSNKRFFIARNFQSKNKVMEFRRFPL